MRRKRKNYTQNEISFIKENYNKFGGKYCSQKLNRSHHCIVQKANKMGLYHTREDEFRIHSLARAKDSLDYPINIDRLVSIKDKEAAYFLGLLWADGYISKPLIGFDKKHLYRIRLKLKAEDFKNLKKLFFSFGKWSTYFTPKGRRGGDSWMIYLTCKPLWEFLINHDYHLKSGESPNKILSKIPEHLQHYWWRGYFDGDGCISGKYLSNLSLASTFNQDWSFVESIFKKLKISKFRIDRKKIITKEGKENKSSVIILQNLENCKLFCDFIYYGRKNDKIGLDRKYDKYLKILNRLERRNFEKLT